MEPPLRTCKSCGTEQPRTQWCYKWSCYKCGQQHIYGRDSIAFTPKSKIKKPRSGAHISREEY